MNQSVKSEGCNGEALETLDAVAEICADKSASSVDCSGSGPALLSFVLCMLPLYI